MSTEASADLADGQRSNECLLGNELIPSQKF